MPSKTIGLSPFEVLFGRPFPTARKISTNLSQSAGSGVDIHLDDYVSKLLDVLQEKHECVCAKLPLPSQSPTFCSRRPGAAAGSQMENTARGA